MKIRTIDYSTIPLEHLEYTHWALNEVGISTLPDLLMNLCRDIAGEIDERFYKARAVNRGLKALGLQTSKEFVDLWVRLAAQKIEFEKQGLTTRCLGSEGSQINNPSPQ